MKQIQPKNKEPTKIAYISDLHGFNYVNEIVKKINKENVSLVVLGGDFTDYTQNGTIKIVKAFLKLDLDILIMPGSHENFEVYENIFNKIKNKKLIDGYKHNYLKIGDYELIIISGSSTVVAGIPRMRGGSYWQIERGVNKKKTQREANKKLKERKISRKGRLIFMDDIFDLTKKHISKTPSSKKIILSHNPPLCKTNKGIDLAIFGIITETFKLKKEHKNKKEFQEIKNDELFEKGQVLTLDEIKILQKYKYPVKIMKKNVGSKDISILMNKYNITKIISGHIHESGKRAINKQEKKVKENQWTKDVRINSGEGKKGLFTIIKLGNQGRIKYEFIKVRKNKN